MIGHREIVGALMAGAPADLPKRERERYRAKGWRVVEPGTPYAAVLGFTTRDWNPASFLAIGGNLVEIALIVARTPGAGAFSRLLARLEGEGFVVCIVEPLAPLQSILIRKGFMPFKVGSTFKDRMTIWRRP